MSYFNYKRRPTHDVRVGNIVMGGNHPIVIQTMTNTNTMDTDASVRQCKVTIDAGAQLVRLTAQGVREADNLKLISDALKKAGYDAPLSADIHFNPRAAFAAAEVVEKVRINPGNFVDKSKRFAQIDYTDEEYADELQKIREKVIPFYQLCQQHNTAVRIGVNHGSLSDRIMSRYGDTAEGMVESCMEYLRLAEEIGFRDIVISMKTSNTLLMTKAVRLLIKQMDAEDMHYPLHLGVTEAGDGEDGRIKSAVGIGALLSDGIGDTIRVSLSEDPEVEIPVARKLVEYITRREQHDPIVGEAYPAYSPYSTDRRQSHAVRNIGGTFLPVVISERHQSQDFSVNPHFIPDYIYVGQNLPNDFPNGLKAIVDVAGWQDSVDCFPLFHAHNFHQAATCSAALKFVELSYGELSDEVLVQLKTQNDVVVILTSTHVNAVGEYRAFFHKLLIEQCDVPVVIKHTYSTDDAETLQVEAGVDFGTILLDGFAEGIMLCHKGALSPQEVDRYAFGILQAARVRTTKTEFISCPSCGRTLFDLQTTVALIKQHFSHLNHLKIGIMGCIVNGPGEMADADYGYVGAEPGKISLYKKKECIEKNIPQAEAVERLIALIKSNGDWVDPE